MSTRNGGILLGTEKGKFPEDVQGNGFPLPDDLLQYIYLNAKRRNGAFSVSRENVQKMYNQMGFHCLKTL